MLRDAVPSNARLALAHAVTIFEALYAGVDEAVPVQRTVTGTILVPVARDTHVALGITQQVQAIDGAVVFAFALLQAALSERIADLTHVAVAIAPALNTALEVRVANLGLPAR